MRGLIFTVLALCLTFLGCEQQPVGPTPGPGSTKPAEKEPKGIRLLTEEYKPYQYLDAGEPAGIGVELVARIFRDAAVAIEGGKIEIDTWQRVYLMLQEQPNAAAFLTVRSKKRETLFKWVGPLAPRHMWLFKLRTRTDIQAKTLEEAKKYRVGGYQSSQTEYMIELGFKNLEIVPYERLNLEKLLKGRVDLVPSLETMVAFRLSEMGHSKDLVEKVVVLDDRFDYYLALNKQVPDETVARLQRALDALRKSGVYDAIMTRHTK